MYLYLSKPSKEMTVIIILHIFWQYAIYIFWEVVPWVVRPLFDYKSKMAHRYKLTKMHQEGVQQEEIMTIKDSQHSTRKL